MKAEIINKASRMFNNAGLQIKKHSPEIFMVVGVVGTVASAVIACKATTKINQVLDEKNKEVDIIKKSIDEGHIIGKEDVKYTEEDYKHDLTIVYAQTGVKLVKLYAPAVVLGTLSIASIVTGHNILRKRNIALAAAYTVVDKGFKEYRKNVVERFGNEIDKELRYNIKAKEIEVEVEDENGKKSVKKEIVDYVDAEHLSDISDYARFFDETSSEYHKDAEYNLMFLRRQQDWANELLKSRGHLFLNEVYDMLGMNRTKAGQVVGWYYDAKKPHGDNYVDFNIYSGSERSRAFVNGYEKAILLDFNVDGPIDYLMEQ